MSTIVKFAPAPFEPNAISTAPNVVPSVVRVNVDNAPPFLAKRIVTLEPDLLTE